MRACKHTAIQREIDRLQELGAAQHGESIDALWARKLDSLQRIEGLIRGLWALGFGADGASDPEPRAQENTLGGPTMSLSIEIDTTNTAADYRWQGEGLSPSRRGERAAPVGDYIVGGFGRFLFNAFGSAGIEVVDSDKATRGDKDFDRDGSAGRAELDLTPGALDTKNAIRCACTSARWGRRRCSRARAEPHRQAHRARQKLAVIKLISRRTFREANPDHRRPVARGERTIRELVIFSDEEITDE